MNNLLLGRVLLAFLSLIPKKYPIESKEKRAEPFFIINSGRCGSTLLNRLLNQHPDVFLPEEQYFLHNLIMKFQLYNWILWRDLSKILAGELIPSLETHWWEFEYEKVYKEIVLAKGDDRSLKKVIDKIFRAYASQLGKSPVKWGDSTPPLIGRYAKEIFHTYPKANYVFLVRDPRDVIASFKKGGGEVPFMHFKDHTEAAKSWVNVYRMSTWVKQKTSRFKVIRYEELVSSPELTLSSLYAFLEVNALEKSVNKADYPDHKFYSMPYHTNLKNPVNTKSIGKWKEELSNQEVNEIMPIIEKPMKELGYL